MTTTEVYTRVAIGKLKEIHEATHPARLHTKRETPAATPTTALDNALEE